MLSDHALLAILTGVNLLQAVVLVWSLGYHRKPRSVALTYTPPKQTVHLAPTHGPHGPVR